MPDPKTGALPLGDAPTLSAHVIGLSLNQRHVRRFLPPSQSRFDTGCAQPCYKERRANQLRVRSSEWRVPAHPRRQKSRIPLSRCPPTTPPARPILSRQLSLSQFKVPGERPPPRSSSGDHL